jgi:membrane protease YdiL (CAAX protease family)
MKNNPSTTGLRIALHNISSLLGAYFFSWALTAFGIVTLVALGVDFQEAEMAMSVLAFLVFLPLFLWAFAYDRPGVAKVFHAA